MRQTEKEKMIVLKKTLREEAHKERVDEIKRMMILKKRLDEKKKMILEKHKDKERFDSIIEKEHFLVKKKLCSVVRCSHTKRCPFYRDPEDYDRKLMKDKLPKTRCTYWSGYPNILKELDYILTGKRIAKKTPAKKSIKAVEKSAKVVSKTILKKDLQKQLLSIDKALKEISERWSIQA